MTPKAIAHIECACPECGIITKIPTETITDKMMSEHLICPNCRKELPDVLNNAIKATVAYQHSLFKINNLSGDDCLRFLFG